MYRLIRFSLIILFGMCGVGLYVFQKNVAFGLRHISEALLPELPHTSGHLIRWLSNKSKSDVPNPDYLEYNYGSRGLTERLEGNCSDNYTVPPIVHYIWLKKPTMAINEYISFLSASLFLKPCFILMHGDVIPRGKWWDRLLLNVSNIIHVKTDGPQEVYGRKLGPTEHKADVLRLDILLQYGGIYLDVDTLILRSYDPLRNHTLVLCRESDISIANGVILAAKDNPFLKIWRLTYNTYNPRAWTDNSVIMGHRLQQVVPEMVHLLESGMIRLGEGYHAVYQTNMKWPESQYSVHIYSRFFNRTDYEIDELKTLKNTYGALCRFILFGTRDVVYS